MEMSLIYERSKRSTLGLESPVLDKSMNDRSNLFSGESPQVVAA